MKSSKNHRIKTGFQQPETSSLQPVSSSQYQVSSIQQPAASGRPFIIPIFLPHAGCPHRCVFCNQVSITGTGQKPVSADQLRSQIRQFLRYRSDRRQTAQISFFGGNFLGLKIEEIKFYLGLAAEFVHRGAVDSIRFSTRPDTVDHKRLAVIADYPVATVELGVQSMDERVLALAKRGHSAADTIRAVERLKSRDYSIGLQMMVGLPGDEPALALTTAAEIGGMQPDFIRIYPTLVVENSLLADWYKSGAYTPLGLEDAVTQVKKLYLFFRTKNIRVIRMGLQASEDLNTGSVLAGPYHPAFGHLVYSEIFLDAACAAIKSVNPTGANLAIFVNPRRIGAMRGLKNSNIALLKGQFGLEKIDIFPDSSLDEDSIKIDNGSPKPCFHIGR
jgi:histone acetyltransferase (RNA polymerase elongator complex component)